MFYIMEDSLINVVYERIKLDKCKLERRELEKVEVDSFNMKDFWNQFGAAVQSLSNEVTKVGFMCGKRPFPQKDELNGMLGDMMQHYSLMRDLYQVLPEEVGVTVYDAVTGAVVNIVTTLLTIVGSLNNLSESGAKERLTLTGSFWDACNAVESLPRDNVAATQKVLQEVTALATDAREELAAAISEDEENKSEDDCVEDTSVWTDQERDLALRAVGLVKVALLCLQKLQSAVSGCASCATPQHCAELDVTVRAAQVVSPALDDFVSELYHPVHLSTALDNAGKLASVLRDLLSSVKGAHFADGLAKDMDKLLLFINHNHNKLDPNVANPVPELAGLSV